MEGDSGEEGGGKTKEAREGCRWERGGDRKGENGGTKEYTGDCRGREGGRYRSDGREE